MTPLLATGVLSGALLVIAPVALGDENQDLDRIPEGIREPNERSGEATGDPRQRLFLENAVTAFSYRGGLLVPPPPQSRPNWQERLSLDARRDWTIGDGLTASYSGRLNFFAEDDIDIPSRQNFRHDLREGFVSWQAEPRRYADLGRINLKSGVAAGFNPTDFFKTRAVVDRTSQDPSVLRENRLGTLMTRGQGIWEGGALTLAYAPRLYDPSRIYAPDALPSLDPMFDRTNAQHRFLLKTNLDLVDDLSPEVLLYREANRTSLGANLTHAIGGSIVAYAEWAGGNRPSLIEDAVRYGQATGTLPAAAPRVLPGDRRAGFQQDLAIGASYTTETKVTFNLEYHFHEAGFSRRDWRNWFAIGRANANFLPVAGQLWFTRSYALGQQEPLSRHSMFLRVNWTDALVRDLELTGIIDANLYDGSSLVQLTANYYWSNRWTFGAIGLVNVGRDRSERGSLPQDGSVVLKAVRYF
jgi:hypothetical protein